MSGPTFTFAYIPAPGGGTVRIWNGGGSVYLHKDWLGSARVVSGLLNHAITADQAYSPYGELYDRFTEATSFSIFAGMTENFDSGVMYDTPNRELSFVGRWLSPDPAGTGWNQYAYPTNPNSDTDPSGLCPEGFCGMGGNAFWNFHLAGDLTPQGSCTIDGLDCGLLGGLLGSDDSNTLLLTSPHGTQYGINAGGGVSNYSNGEDLTAKDLTELRLPSPGAWNLGVSTFSAANNGINPITSTFRLITKSDYCRGGDRTIQYWLVDTSTGGMPSSNWWVTEQIQAPVPTNSGGTNNTPNQYLDFLSNGGTPYKALQSFTVSQGSGAPSYQVYVRIGGQDYGKLGLWMSNNPLRNGQPSPNSVNCPPQ